MSSKDNLYNDDLYTQYCSAFNQLIEIANNPDETVDAEKLHDMSITLTALEEAYATEHNQLKENISLERARIMLKNVYSRLDNGNQTGYSKKS